MNIMQTIRGGITNAPVKCVATSGKKSGDESMWPYVNGVRPTIVRKVWNCSKCGGSIPAYSHVIKRKSHERFCNGCMPLERYFEQIGINVVRSGRETVHFYECDMYDKETHRCTAHDRRPRVCWGYPHYGRGQQLPGTFVPYSATCDYIHDMTPAMKQEWIAVAEELERLT